MKILKARFFFCMTVVFACFAVIVARLFTVQVLEGRAYAARSRGQSQQRVVLNARRGRILDRKGRLLAVSVDRPLRLEHYSGAGPAGAAIERLYPNGELAAPLLGYLGKDGDGLGGAELAFDRLLRGEDGWAIIQRDAVVRSGNRHRYRDVHSPQKEPRGGNDVYLTVDLEVQKILQNILSETREFLDAKSAMGMIMQPGTGRILAMANVPCFDPNVPARFPLARRRNLCISHNFEPGSTFKVLTAAAALDKDVYGERDSIDGNNGVFVIYNETIRDHRPFGMLTFADALTFSSNVCFAKIAGKVGNKNLYDYTCNFGLGERTGIVLPGEESGTVHPIREWSGRTGVTMAIGQEISVTLLQMMLVYAAVANDGVLVKPRICDKIVSVGGDIVDSTVMQPVRRVISREVSARLKIMLRRVVEYGTGSRAAVEGISVAGKTGTSQKFIRETNSYSDSAHYSSFIGFLPAENPVLLCGIVIDEPRDALTGGIAAAPAFGRIIGRILSHPDLEFAAQILDRPRDIPVETASVSLLGGVKRVFAGQLERIRDVIPELADAENAPEKSYMSMPDCLGMDLREAVNMLNARGIVPHVCGSGVVTAQQPVVGTVIREDQPCSLVCAFGS